MIRPMVTVARIERILWLLAALILVLGYWSVTKAYDGRINRVAARAQDEYRQTLTNRHLLANAGRIDPLRRELRRRLAGTLSSEAAPQITAALVQDLDRQAREHACWLTAIDPKPPQNRDVTPPARKGWADTPPGELQKVEFAITVRGTFSNLLALASVLPRAHTLLKVDRISFSLAGGKRGRTGAPLLDAKISSSVYRMSSTHGIGVL